MPDDAADFCGLCYPQCFFQRGNQSESQCFGLANAIALTLLVLATHA